MKIKATDLVNNHFDEDFTTEDLTAGRDYTVIGIEGEFFRIVDDAGEPLLYPKDLFKVVDPTIPSDWIETNFDGESYIEPPDTSDPGFYEDYFDDVPYAKNVFKKLLRRLGLQ